MTNSLPLAAAPQGMVGAWEAACGPLDQYGMRHTRAFANLCNAGLPPAALGDAAGGVCGGATAAVASAATVGPSRLVGPDAHVQEA